MISADRLAQTSRWRHWPLRDKAVLALGLLALALALQPWPGGAVILAAAAAAALTAGTSPGALLRLALPPLGFVATGCLTLLIDIGPHGFGWAADHGERAMAVGLRAAAGIASLLLLSVTSSAASVIQGLRRIGLPPEIAEVALTTYRFLFLLLDTASAIHTTQAARLGHVGWRRSIRSTGRLAAALLPRALDRAQRLEQGLAARGFNGTLPTLAPPRSADPKRLPLILGALCLLGWMGSWM